jgi:2,4-dienoyl-CoA reductase-like NADH-dependent reductase (Old Yellow Enzyme family)
MCAKVGADFPVLIRMSARENVPGGIELKDAAWRPRSTRTPGLMP